MLVGDGDGDGADHHSHVWDDAFSLHDDVSVGRTQPRSIKFRKVQTSRDLIEKQEVHTIPLSHPAPQKKSKKRTMNHFHLHQTNPLSFQSPISSHQVLTSSFSPVPPTTTTSTRTSSSILQDIIIPQPITQHTPMMLPGKESSLPSFVDQELKKKDTSKRKHRYSFYTPSPPPTQTTSGNKTRGRPPLSSQLSDDFKVKVAMSVAKYRVPYEHVEELAKMWTGDETISITKSTIHSILMEVYGRVFSHLSTNTILNSTNLIATVDGSSDLIHQRQPIAIQLRGEKEGIPWAYSIRFAEVEDHKAVTQLNLFQKLFEDITTLGIDKVYSCCCCCCLGIFWFLGFEERERGVEGFGV
jgi:hypothetical protein